MSVAMSLQDAPPEPLGQHYEIAPNGRLRRRDLTDTERTLGIMLHLTSMLGAMFLPLVITPLVIWVVQKDKSAFIDDQGREVVNVLLTGLILGAASIFILTIPLILVWGIFIFINQIIAAVAVSNGEHFRYPMTIRFLT